MSKQTANKLLINLQAHLPFLKTFPPLSAITNNKNYPTLPHPNLNNHSIHKNKYQNKTDQSPNKKNLSNQSPPELPNDKMPQLKFALLF